MAEAEKIVVRRFKKKRNTEPVEIEEEDGTVKSYTMRELQGPEREQFVSMVTSRTKTDDNGNPVAMKDTGDLQVKLISMCLYDSFNKGVAQSVIAALPSTAIMGLFEMAQQLSGLDKKAQAREKKD